jgi:hypothetical protein
MGDWGKRWGNETAEIGLGHEVREMLENASAVRAKIEAD